MFLSVDTDVLFCYFCKYVIQDDCSYMYALSRVTCCSVAVVLSIVAAP